MNELARKVFVREMLCTITQVFLSFEFRFPRFSYILKKLLSLFDYKFEKKFILNFGRIYEKIKAPVKRLHGLNSIFWPLDYKHQIIKV